MVNLGKKARYATELGSAYHGNALPLLSKIPDASINLILTSPPFPLNNKKSYGNVRAEDYFAWFIQFASEFSRILRDDGSLVLELGAGWTRGEPTRSIYQYKLLVHLCEHLSFKLAQEFYWYNPAKLPTPAQWVTIERIRVKDAVTSIWWLSKSARPKADNRHILKPYSKAMIRLLNHGYNDGMRPSGHNISKTFSRDNGGAIPPNLLSYSNTVSVDPYLALCRTKGLAPHPARFPNDLPPFFIQFLTDVGDLVLDPFAGSNLTGYAAEQLGRRWIAIELVDEHLRGSMLRFPKNSLLPTAKRTKRARRVHSPTKGM